MRDTFFFQLHTRLHHGVGWSRQLPGLLRDNGYRRVLVMVDAGVARHSAYYREIRALLAEAAESLPVIELRGSEEPSYDYLDGVAADARSLGPLDAVIGIGGGSALDTTKAVAALLTNDGPGIAYRGFDKVVNPPVPTIAVPTTAGTGSEVTINAVFTDKAEMRKLGINGRHMNAAWAVLDAEWLASCPPAAALSAGMDALVHTLESFMTNNANPLTRALNREAFRLLHAHLPALVETPGDRERLQSLLLGSYLAAAGLFNSGSGVAGALSYPLGVHYGVPHGIAGGIFIASVVAFNVERGYTDYADLLDVVEPHPDWDVPAKAERFAGLLRALCDRLGVPRTLDRWGVTRAELDRAAGLMLPMQAAFNQNPVPFSAATDARAMLERHLA